MKKTFGLIGTFCLLTLLVHGPGSAQVMKEGTRMLNEALELANKAHSEADLDKALRKCEHAKRFFEEVGSKMLLRMAILCLGKVHGLKGDHEKAVHYNRKLLAEAAEAQDQFTEALALNNLATLYLERHRYEQALDLFKRSLSLNRKLGVNVIQAMTLNNIGEVHLHRDRYDEAAEHFRKSLAEGKRVKNLRAQATALTNLAGVCVRRGQHEKALAFYWRSLRISREQKYARLEGTILCNVGDVYRIRGRHDKAAEYYQKSLDIARNLKHRTVEVTALNGLGIVYGSWDYYPRALGFCKDALAASRRAKDRSGESTSLGNLGWIYAAWGDYDRATEFYRKALALDRELKDRSSEAGTLSGLGMVYYSRGQYDKAEEFLRVSLKIRKEIKNQLGQADVFNNLGLLYSDWGRYDKAIEYYRKSLELAKGLGNITSEGTALGNLGAVYFTLGQNDKAEQLFKKSLDSARKLRDRRSQASMLAHLGSICARRGEHNKALKHFHEGLAICRGIAISTGQSKDLIGNLYLDMGMIERAEPFLAATRYRSSLGRLDLLRSAYERARDNYGKLLEWALENRDAASLFIAYTGLGLAYEGMGNDPMAVKHFQKAVEHTEHLRLRLTRAQKEKFFDVRIGGFYRTAPYEGLARVLLRMQKPEEAFRTSEYAKARVFSESMSRPSAGTSFDIPEDVVKLDNQINDQLVALKRRRQQAFEKNKKEAVELLEPQVKKLERRLRAHVRMLRDAYPLFAATKYPQPMELSESALREDEWVLVYDVTDSGVLIYLTKGKRLIKAVFKPIERKDLDALVSMFRKPLEIVSGRDDLDKKLASFDLGSGGKLADLLLKEALEQLPPKVPLIIVPDDSLGVLPFEMLILNSGARIASDGQIPRIEGAGFFGDRNPVSYYQSVTALTLARTFARHREKGRKVLVMADPVFSSNDPRLKRAASGKRGGEPSSVRDKLMSMKNEMGLIFSRLPLTGELGKSLKKLDPENTDQYSGLKAEKPVLVKKRLERYGSMIFATHGYFGNDLPGIQEPVLVLTLVHQPKGQDGFLRMSEVMGLKMNSDIVALTACQTGLGRRVTGEGVMGMGRAFQYAGAKSVLISLWSVAEKPSVMLVESIFRNLRKGTSGLEALRLARREIRQAGYDHPFFWAPFILVGEPN
jgi:tetratricopeptide (TPR) repeat protein